MNFIRDYFCLRKKYLVFNLVTRNLKIKYRRSFLGIFWTLLVPICMASVYYFVFQVIMKVQVPNYLITVMCGILPWTFFQQSVAEASESIVGNAQLISKIPVPIQVFPFITILTNFTTLLASLPLIVFIAAYSGLQLGLYTFLILFYFILLFLLAYSLSILLSVFYVFLRDLKHVIGIILQICFYATPVLFLEDMVPARYQWILTANPVGHVFTGIHDILLREKFPPAENILTAVTWTLGLSIIAMLFFRKNQKIAELL